MKYEMRPATLHWADSGCLGASGVAARSYWFARLRVPAPLIRSGFGCWCGVRPYFRVPGAETTQKVEASGPAPLQAYAVRTASSALRLQRRDIRAAVFGCRQLIGFALALIRSRRVARLSAGASNQSNFQCGRGISCCCSLLGESDAEMRQASRPSRFR